jgi:hypothetical protein
MGTIESRKIIKSVTMFMQEGVLKTINSSMHLPVNCGARDAKGLQMHR